MFYFTCSPEHKLFLLFTVLNNEDTNIFWDGELTKQYVSDLRQVCDFHQVLQFPPLITLTDTV